MTFEEKLAFLEELKVNISKDVRDSIAKDNEDEALYFSGAESMLNKVLHLLKK